MTHPDDTAAMVEKLIQGYREHAAADDEADEPDEDPGEDPDCELLARTA